MREAANQLDQARRASERTTQELAAIIGSARLKDRQQRWLLATAGVALIAGLIISPVLAPALPFGLDGGVAAFILQADRWNAGAALMQAQSPEAWRVLMDAAKLTADNSAALASCRDAAAKTKKEQHCTFVVPAPRLDGYQPASYLHHK